MKNALFGVVALAAVSMAEAADISLKGPGPVPAVLPAAPAVSWTGCYIGGHIGGGAASKDWLNPSLFPDEPGDHGQADFGGFIGGGQIGCDFHFTPTWLTVGIQGMFDGAELRGDVIDTQNGFDLTTRVHWFGTLTGRLGFTVQANWLLYVKGGATWIRDHHLTFDVNGLPFDTADVTRTGWTIGGGAEWKFLPNWSVFVEYGFLDFGTRSIPFTFATGGFSETWDVKQQVQAIVGGINFRFGWGGPVVARY